MHGPVPSSDQLAAMETVKKLFLATLLLQISACVELEDGTTHSNTSDTSSRDLQLVLGEMYALVEEHSLIVDPHSHQDRYSSILSRFNTCLLELNHVNETTLLDQWMDMLTNAVIRGVHRIRGYAIKHALSSGEYLTVHPNTISSPWNTDVLVTLFRWRHTLARWGEFKVGGACNNAARSDVICPLNLAVKLGLADISKLLVEERGGFCMTFDPLRCSSALHYAVLNQDIATIDYFLGHVSMELEQAGMEPRTDLRHIRTEPGHNGLEQEQIRMEPGHVKTESAPTEGVKVYDILCNLLTQDGGSVGKPALDIAHHSCSASNGAICDTYNHLLAHVHTYCDDDWSPLTDSSSYSHHHPLTSQPLLTRAHMKGAEKLSGWRDHSLAWWGPEHTLPYTCPVKNRPSTFDVSLRGRFRSCLLEGKGCDFTALSGGWRVYTEHSVGRSDCDLARVSVDQLTSLEFERDFVNMSVPVLLTGLTRRWPLLREWTRGRLSQHWTNLDLLVGSIPYGEVFGDRFGYASVSEFLTYMDGYAQVASLNVADSADFKAPLYVFDGVLLESQFKRMYGFGVLNISHWQSVPQYPQFILGPAGSGAPFHFHCHALNALVYGRKKWFLTPPSAALYSKQHPLLWYNTEYPSWETNPIECVQGPGEVLYVPARWAHSTINLDECIGLAVEIDAGDC